MDKPTLDKINEIRSKADIVEVISKYIDVSKKGRNFEAICPFHDDSNPSLKISKDKQIYKCFVCNEAGNAFTFIQKYKKVPFMVAVKEVADMVGIELNINNNDKPKEIIDPKKQILYDIIKEATLFYKNSLNSNIDAQNYCKERNLTSKIINDFNIGYSVDYDKLINYLLAKGYKKEDIYRSGIANENNGKLSDMFAKRIIFPITDLEGRIIGFSGRSLEKNALLRYVNSNDSEIFIKGNTLYNYASALNYIKASKAMYITEGYMDTIALVKSGINNTVALMGTAFTKEHLKIFKYLGVKIILALDGDDPGNNNANKLANELANKKIDVSIIPHYEDCKDADEYFNKYGESKLALHLNSVAMNCFDFNFYVAKKGNTLQNNEDKKKFLKNMCAQISKMDLIDADIYANKLHEQLGFSMSTINALINEQRNKEREDVVSEIKKFQKLNKRKDLEVRLISSMFDSKEAIISYIESMVYLEDESYRRLANMISEYYEENKENFDIENLNADLYSRVAIDLNNDSELINALKTIDSYKENIPKYNKVAFNDLIYQIDKIEPLEEKLRKLSEDIKFARKEEINDYIKEAIQLREQIALLKKGR